MKEFLLFTQSDNRWCNDVMTGVLDLPNITREEQIKRWKYGTDTIGMTGCLITSLCNAYNCNKNALIYTPASLNLTLRQKKGYYVLRHKNDCQIAQESFLYWDVAESVLGIEEIKHDFTKKIDLSEKGYYYLLRCPYDPYNGINSGHYNLIVDMHNDNPIHYDSDKGVIRTDYTQKHIDYRIIRIKLK